MCLTRDIQLFNLQLKITPHQGSSKLMSRVVYSTFSALLKSPVIGRRSSVPTVT